MKREPTKVIQILSSSLFYIANQDTLLFKVVNSMFTIIIPNIILQLGLIEWVYRNEAVQKSTP